MTMADLRALYDAIELSAKWGGLKHSSTCSGFTGAWINKEGEKFPYDEPMPREKWHEWWCEMNEAHCTCGVVALREVASHRHLNSYTRRRKSNTFVGSPHGYEQMVLANQVEIESLQKEIIAGANREEALEKEIDRLKRLCQRANIALGSA